MEGPLEAPTVRRMGVSLRVLVASDEPAVEGGGDIVKLEYVVRN